MTLFDPGPALDLPDKPDDSDSSDVRRRKRAERFIAAGIHPLTRRPLMGNDETCGTCAHCIRVGHTSRTYFKCDLVPVTRGPGTDIRLRWPACRSWMQQKEPPPSRRKAAAAGSSDGSLPGSA